MCLSNQSQCFKVDPAGKEVKRFQVQGVSNFGNELLPNGHVLVPLQWQNKVTEYDGEGKVVWEGTAPQPMAATRLPNGNTLVALQQWPAKVVELDRTGKQVAELSVANYASRVRRR